MNRLIHELPDREDEDELRQQVAVCVFLAVAMLETFVNSFFRTLIRRPEYHPHAVWINADLTGRRPLSRKLDTWPQAVFGRRFGDDAPKAKRVTKVIELRNRLMHFSPELQPLVLAGHQIPMIDSDVFDSLAEDTAVEAANVCYAAIEWLIRCQYPADAAAEQMHMWTVTSRAS